MRDFRIGPTEIGRVSELIGYHQESTSCSGYRCSVLATCVLMNRLAAPYQWHALKFDFGCRYYESPEFFWKALENFIKIQAKFIETARYDLVTERAEMYVDAI